MKKHEFFELKTESRIELGRKWSQQELETPVWLSEWLKSIQEKKGIRIQLAYEIFERMYTYNLGEEEAYQELKKEFEKRKIENRKR